MMWEAPTAMEEIKITPEMIEAATLEFLNWGDYETPDYWARRIVLAALTAGGFSVMESEP